jgi:hypothetical protein
VPNRVGRVQQGTGAINEIAIGEAAGDVAEPNQGREHSGDSRVPEAKSRSVETVVSSGRSGHRWKVATSGAGIASAASASHRRR